MAGVEDVNHYFFRQAARVLALSPRVERLLVTPYREVKVDVSTTLDGVTVSYFEWVQNVQQFT
jgi:hypothetical protein